MQNQNENKPLSHSPNPNKLRNQNQNANKPLSQNHNKLFTKNEKKG
jgi:hypothetical protein